MDEDREDLFNHLSKFFEMMQNEVTRVLRDQMENGDLDEGINFMNQGFKIELGPDGPRFSPITQNEYQHFNQDTISWEKPYTEVFVIDEGKKYQIIAEMPGIETEDVKIHFKDDQKIMIQAETEEYKYRKGLMLKFSVDSDSVKYTVRNGVLEIFVNINND
ncbi:MAG: Hsp20 family protein [Candidatus Heimdallarchaeota archaeon]|nr:Hsp20 family protein [Candidatus Heimdallarchaeota archaeon]